MERNASVTALFEAYLQQLNRPDPVDFTTFCARHPAHSRALRRLWNSMNLIDLLGVEDGEVGGGGLGSE